MDLLADRSRNHGGLAAEHLGLGMFQGRTVGDVPGRGAEAVAVALLEAIGRRHLAGDRLLQHLWLPALVVQRMDQPEVVPRRARVVGQGEEVPAGERRIALALGQLVVAAQALQGAFGQVLAARALAEAAGVVVDLQLRHERAAAAGFQRQPRLLEVVVAVAGPAAAGFQAHAEGAHHLVIGGQAAVLLIGQWRQLGENGLIVAEHQHMAVRAVLEVVVDTFLLAQALHEVQVGLVVLHTVVA
ncbi:hypothetical protein D3C81_1424080 [compost metagenome]